MIGKIDSCKSQRAFVIFSERFRPSACLRRSDPRHCLELAVKEEGVTISERFGNLRDRQFRFPQKVGGALYALADHELPW